MQYTLFNKRDKRHLVHPTVGLWFTSDYNEAESMLVACQEWLEDHGMDEQKEHFVIVDVETGEEIEAPAHDIESEGVGGED